MCGTIFANVRFRHFDHAEVLIIELFHNGGQIKYSYVLMLISPSRLAKVSTIQKNFCFQMGTADQIAMDAKE